MTLYDPMSKTAEEWRAEAKASSQRSAESWERSDTDGFLSQWASDSMARLYSTAADLAENGGMAEFTVLADAEGNEIEGARQVETRFGFSWVHEVDGASVWFNESMARDPQVAAARNAAKGYSFVTVTKPAMVGFGRSNGLTAPVVVVPKQEAKV